MEHKKAKTNIFSNIICHPLPKWNDLPEIDLYMDQVIALMEKYLSDTTSQDSKLITQSMVNNYVKLGIMPAPIKKKYSREHLAYLVIICSLKQVIPLYVIKQMINEKLKNNTISEILDFFSNLYEFTFSTVSQTCLDYLNSNESNQESLENTSFFTAISAANLINISNKLLDKNVTPKAKNKENKNNKHG